ncbi:cystatin-11 [Moschus berezovskii]|uniref:cystatin-11 n=1 Tax=Moschus berezovskii TaxID=68408 RepID=UPI0024453404|nr:cystatin-11 [Moschus berezovskii]
MARPWQGPRLLLAVVGALVALSYQSKRKTFILVYEVPVSDPVVVTTMGFLTEEFNRKNKDPYNFRIVRVLKAVKRLTDHLEYQVNLEMRRTTCLKSELTNCSFQEGKLYKGLPASVRLLLGCLLFPFENTLSSCHHDCAAETSPQEEGLLP